MKQIFIIGSPRSGTTLLQTMLGTAELVLSLPETHFFEFFFSCPLERTTFPLHIKDAFYLHLRRHARPLFLEAYKKIIDETCHDSEIQAKYPTPQKFIAMLDNAAISSGKTTWIEKTPGHIRRIPVIRSIAPDAYFVHIHRRFTPVFESLQRAHATYSEAKNTLSARPKKRELIRWKENIKRSIYWTCKDPAKHQYIRYEDLCTSPQTVIPKLFNWLQLPYSKNCWQEHHKLAQMVISKSEPWKARNKYATIEPRQADLTKDTNPNAEQIYQLLQPIAKSNNADKNNTAPKEYLRANKLPNGTANK